MSTRSETVAGVTFAVAFVVASAGLILLVGGLVFETRATVPGLGLLLLIVGVLVSYEFGVRTALRNNKPVLASLRSGLILVGRWSKRMAGADRSRR